MNRGAARIDNTEADGLRAVCDTAAQLPDLCHHAEYRIYVNGHLIGYREVDGKYGGPSTVAVRVIGAARAPDGG